MRYLVAAILALVVHYVIVVWVGCLSFNGPMILSHAFLYLALLTGFSLLVGDENRVARGTGIFAGVVLVIIFIMDIIVPMGEATKLRDIGQVKVVERPLNVADLKHIRIIPKEAAEQIGHTVMGGGNLGAFFHAGEYEIQRYGKNKELFWVAPLEFNGYWEWVRSGGISPGYIMVNAVNRFSEPILVEGFKMRYLDTSYWGWNNQRHLFLTGGGVSLTQIEPTFEIDDSGRPYMVTTMSTPTVGFTGHKVVKIKVMDVQTGEVETYDLGKTPSWVDRAFPETLAEDYARWWGEYVGGYWNALSFGKKNVQTLTSVTVNVLKEGKNGSKYYDQEQIQDVFLVDNQIGNPVWFAGMTSPSAKDQSMTGYIAADSQTGQIEFYRLDRGLANEQAAINAVNAAVAQYKSYHATQAIFYRPYGIDTWIVPVLSSNNLVEKVGIVYARNYQIVVIGNDKTDALREYQRILAEQRVPELVPSLDHMTLKIQGKKITRCNLSGNTLYLQVEGLNDRVISVPSTVSLEIFLTQKGDLVDLSLYDTGEGISEARSFDNRNLQIRVSTIQQEHLQEVETQTAESKAAIEAKQQELRKQIDGLKKEADDQ